MWILCQVELSIICSVDSIQWGRFIRTSGATFFNTSGSRPRLVQSGTNFDGRKVCDAYQSNAHKQHRANSADSALLLFMKYQDAPQIAQEYDDTRPQACAYCQSRSSHCEYTRRPSRNPKNGRHEGPVCKVCKAPVVERVWVCSMHQVAKCDEKQRCDEYCDCLVGLEHQGIDVDASRDLTFHRNRVTPKAQSSESGGREAEQIGGIGGRHVFADGMSA
mmetsp:Transcript_24331/g.57833  ORF Transcript_24331/g.57833 Transcript_24331/m.57833 type:complete len:219 (-) Transcript_24331:177-833(-)